MKKRFLSVDFPANLLHKEGWTLEFNEEFNSLSLNPNHWIPYYLPHWSSREHSRPRYRFTGENLVLQITEDQLPWCPEFNGAVKCSSLQTGLYAGKLNSPNGQHAFNPACRVREEQVAEKKYLPHYGYIEIRAKVPPTPNNVSALWMIGYEENPEESAEICIVEIKGENLKKESTKIGYGIHKFNDPSLKEEFYEEEFTIDPTFFHIYAVEWKPGQTRFYIDNQCIRTLNQAPDYPMQLMLNIYEIPADKPEQNPCFSYPHEFTIDYIRGYKIN